MIKRIVLGCIVAVFLASAATPAHASAKDVFCKVDRHFKGSTDILRITGGTTLALSQINYILTLALAINMTYEVEKGLNTVGAVKRTLKRLKVIKQLETYIRSMTYFFDSMEKFFQMGEGVVQQFKPTKLNKARTIVRKAYAGMAIATASLTALKGISLGVCGKTSVFVNICTKKNLKCGLSFDSPNTIPLALYSKRSCAMTDEDRIKKYVALSLRVKPLMTKLDAALSKYSSVLKAISPGVKAAAKVLNPMKAPMKGVGGFFKGFNKGMAPLRYTMKKFESLLQKKLCATMKIKIGKIKKKTKKCSTINNMLKNAKKLGSFMKPLQKQANKLIDPLVKVLQKQMMKIKIPGLSKMKGVMNKTTAPIAKLTTHANFLGTNPFASFTAQMKKLDADFKALLP